MGCDAFKNFVEGITEMLALEGEIAIPDSIPDSWKAMYGLASKFVKCA